MKGKKRGIIILQNDKYKNSISNYLIGNFESVNEVKISSEVAIQFGYWTFSDRYKAYKEKLNKQHILYIFTYKQSDDYVRKFLAEMINIFSLEKTYILIEGEEEWIKPLK